MRDLDFGKDLIRKKIQLVSNSPGVYRMLDKKNQVLYVGKAKNLPNRLKSYALDKNQPIRTERMLALTQNLEIITTNSEAEALLLEANLIKKFKPKFNVLLRDDKSFPYIFIEKDCDWPQLSKHRGKKNKNGYYFGPFASVGSANWTIKILQKVFLLRVCNDSVFKNRDRPCILYQIKRCSAPCVGYVEKKDYKNSVDDAIKFVSGKSRDIQKNLSKQMEEASEKLDFEKASIFRDRIKSLNIIQSSQRINEANLVEADVIAAYKESGKTCIQVFFYRSKQNWGNQAYFPKHDPDQSISEIMSSFLMQFYENKNVPKLIILNLEIKDKKLIEQTKVLTRGLKNEMNNQNLNNYIKSVIKISFLTNKYINDEEPWKLKKNNIEQMNNILHIALEQIAKISILLSPIIPNASAKVLNALNINTELKNFSFLDGKNIITDEIKIKELDILFKKITK